MSSDSAAPSDFEAPDFEPAPASGPPPSSGEPPHDGVRESTKPGDESAEPRLGLFQGYGVELEYMIVDRDSLDVRPVADRLIAEVAGDVVSEVERGRLAWSNELALHVLELKTNGPAPRLEGLAAGFHTEVRTANRILAEMGCRLLPGGMHPWMDPDRDMRIWPHEYTEVYRTFDRIFSCRGHGWANLQSTHLNLPFQGDREFAALHEAIRLVLPILPALTASSPFLDGKTGTHLDERLAAYRTNAARVPSVTGRVVPERMESRKEYEEVLLGGIYRDLAPLDPESVLRHEWVNARGAIARFQRGSIEIRVLDSQECPGADVAVAALVSAVVEALCAEVLDDPARFTGFETEALARILDDVLREGDAAVIRDPAYLDIFGLALPSSPLRAGELWAGIAERAGVIRMGSGDSGGRPREPSEERSREWTRTRLEAPPEGRRHEGPRERLGAGLRKRPEARSREWPEEWRPFLETILEKGPLARRLLAASGPQPSRERLREVYRELAGCLEENRPFLGEGGPA